MPKIKLYKINIKYIIKYAENIIKILRYFIYNMELKYIQNIIKVNWILSVLKTYKKKFVKLLINANIFII